METKEILPYILICSERVRLWNGFVSVVNALLIQKSFVQEWQ